MSLYKGIFETLKPSGVSKIGFGFLFLDFYWDFLELYILKEQFIIIVIRLIPIRKPPIT